VRKSKADPTLIPLLVERGISYQEIANRMGWTVGTLRVRCSQLKISLRKQSTKTVGLQPIKIVLPQAIIEQLYQRAAVMGVSTATLAADLLEEIARDDLYDAVLDRVDTEVTCVIPSVR
jgi:hypothetical protein